MKFKIVKSQCVRFKNKLAKKIWLGMSRVSFSTSSFYKKHHGSKKGFSDLAYADDVVLIGRDYKATANFFLAVNALVAKHGMTLSPDGGADSLCNKTAYLGINWRKKEIYKC